MNTSAGVVPTSTIPSGGPSSSVLQSLSYSGALRFDTIVYRYDGGVGGATFGSSPPPAATWIAIPFSGYSSPAVYDLAVHSAVLITPNPNIYVASALGAFGFSYTLLSNASTTMNSLISQGGFFSVIDSSGNSPVINSLAVDDTNNLLYVGTNNGVYTTAVSNVDNVVGTGQKYTITSSALAGTSGHAFSRVITFAFNFGNYSTTYWAGWSKSKFYYGQSTGTTSSVPVASVSLGTPDGIGLIYAGSNWYLVIAGSEGLSFVPIG